MKLVSILALCIYLVVATDFETFFKQVLDKSESNDVAFVGIDPDVLDSVTQSTKSLLQIRLINLDKSYTNSRKCSVFLIQFPKSKSEISDSPCFNHEGYFVIILEKSMKNSVDLQKSSQSLKELGILKAVFVLYDQYDGKIEIWLYYIFHKVLINVSIPQAIDHLAERKSFKFYSYKYRVLVRLLHPYLYLEHGQLKGLDKQLLDIFSEAHHATVEYGFKGTVDENFSFALEHSQPRSAFDLSLFRSYTITDTFLDKVYLPEWDELCIAIPKRHQGLGLLQLTKPFNVELWILISALIVAKICCKTFKIRFITISFIILEFALTEGYLVKVIQFLSDMKYIPDPQTIAEAIKRGEIFEVYPDEVEVLQGFKGAVTRTINKDKHLGDYATIHFCKTAQFFENSELNFNPRTNDKLIVILKERVRPFASCYGFAKNHPIRSLFERYLRMVFESGIWRKIYDQYVNTEDQFRVLLRPNDYPINFKDLNSLWMFVGLGLTASFVCFLAEICKKH